MLRLLSVCGLVTAILLALDHGRGDGHRFRAELSGDEEVPAVATEMSGKFRIEFAEDYSSATFRMDVRDGVRVTQSHLHCGEEGVNGPVIVFLGGFHDRGWDIDGRWLDGVTVTDENIVNTACGSTLRDIAQAIEEGRIYVNVHTVAVPSGEIRGQLDAD